MAELAAGRWRARQAGSADQGHGLLRCERHGQPGPVLQLLAGRQLARAQGLRSAAELAGLPSSPRVRPVTARTASAGRDRASYLRDVCRLLWPAPAEAVLVRARPAAARPLDQPGNAGGEQGDSPMLVLPGLRQPPLVGPRDRRPGSAAVRRYGEPASARTRLAARALSATLASGIGDLGVRDPILIRGPPRAPTIESHLSPGLAPRAQA